jgi:hypothetical protein
VKNLDGYQRRRGGGGRRAGGSAARAGWNRGGHAWAGPGKEERKMGRAQRNRRIFDLFKRISNESDLIQLKDGFLNSKIFN